MALLDLLDQTLTFECLNASDVLDLLEGKRTGVLAMLEEEVAVSGPTRSSDTRWVNDIPSAICTRDQRSYAYPLPYLHTLPYLYICHVSTTGAEILFTPPPLWWLRRCPRARTRTSSTR